MDLGRIRVTINGSVLALVALALVACGSSGGGASSTPPTAETISGTVAAGTAVTGTVSVYDSSANAQPRSASTAIATGGQYSVTVTSFTAPFLVEATGQVGGQGPTVTMYAVATAAGTVNVTPITTLMALNMAAGNIQTLMSGSGSSLPGLTATDLSDQNTNMDTLLSSVLTGEGLGATYNFSTTSFTVGSPGYDQLLDNVTVVTTNPAAVTVTDNAAPGSPVTIDTADGSANGTLDITSGPTTLPTTGYTIGGTVIGLGASATVDVLNGSDNVPISSNGSFTLPTAVASGGTYSVSVGTPTSTQTCGVQNASGTIASANVTNVVVYCTYNVSDATLDNTYTAAIANYGNGSNDPLDADSAVIYNGTGSTSLTSTINSAGSIFSGVPQSATYDVTTTNAIPSVGIEGVDADAIVGVTVQDGTPPLAAVDVLPNTNATTDSVNGNYTHVLLLAYLSNGDIEADEGPVSLTNGSWASTFTSNTAGTIVTGNSGSGTLTISNGLVSQNGGVQQGAVSADGDLIVLADTHSGDNPDIDVLVLQGTGVTQATFEGVYSVAAYGGLSITTTFGEAYTLFAYGNGTYSVIYTKNADGTITTNNTDSGTYTMAADGTLTLTDSEGDAYNGAISADGNALVLANITGGESPKIWVGVRQ